MGREQSVLDQIPRNIHGSQQRAANWTYVSPEPGHADLEAAGDGFEALAFDRAGDYIKEEALRGAREFAG
jgi:hypothetical protein